MSCLYKIVVSLNILLALELIQAHAWWKRDWLIFFHAISFRTDFSEILTLFVSVALTKGDAMGIFVLTLSTDSLFFKCWVY